MDIVRLGQSDQMSQVVIFNGIAHLSGQIAWETQSGDIAAQMTEILQSIDRLLAQAGTDKSRLLTASIWLADISDFQTMNEVWLNWVDEDNAPARATVQAALAFPSLKVEVQATAAVPS